METLPVLFIVTSLILIITPGEDMLLVMSRSIAEGSKAGVATAAGVSTGLLGHTALATLGLGAVLSASEMLFVAIKLVGAAYLIYLGIRLFLRRQSDLDMEKLSQTSLKKMSPGGHLQHFQPQDHHLLFCLPAPIRTRRRRKSHLSPSAVGSLVCSVDLYRERADRLRRGHSFRLAAGAARGDRLDASSERPGAHRPGA